MVYEKSPHKLVGVHPLYTLNNQFFFIAQLYVHAIWLTKHIHPISSLWISVASYECTFGIFGHNLGAKKITLDFSVFSEVLGCIGYSVCQRYQRLPSIGNMIVWHDWIMKIPSISVAKAQELTNKLKLQHSVASIYVKYLDVLDKATWDFVNYAIRFGWFIWIYYINLLHWQFVEGEGGATINPVFRWIWQSAEVIEFTLLYCQEKIHAFTCGRALAA